MITKELVEQWNKDWVEATDSICSQLQYIAQRAAAHGAAQRDAELMAVGMEPVAWMVASFDWTNPMVQVNKPTALLKKETVQPLYTVTQLAAARLQGADALSEQYAKLAQHCTMLEDKLAQCEKPIGLPDLDAQLMEQHQRITALETLIKKVHTAKGRYHTQLSVCDLYDAVGLANERPKK